MKVIVATAILYNLTIHGNEKNSEEWMNYEDENVVDPITKQNVIIGVNVWQLLILNHFDNGV